MPVEQVSKPVEDTISRVNDEIAVGSDPEFQRKWWRVESIIWVVLTIILVLDVAGCFGRGYIAKAKKKAADGSIEAQYERIARFGTPSRMTVRFGAGAVRDNKVQLWTSESLATELGMRRIVPQPASSTIERGGIVYNFPVNSSTGSVEFSLEPAAPGPHNITLRAAGREELSLRVFVMP